MSDLILVAGKRYVTRSGWITPPLEFDDEFMEDYPFYAGESNECSIGIQSWTRNGLCHRLGKLADGADLVREYVPEPSVPGVPEGWRVVRYGLLGVGDYWLPPSGVPLENTVPPNDAVNQIFNAVIVERIASA
jgi:hypothetical protein